MKSAELDVVDDDDDDDDDRYSSVLEVLVEPLSVSYATKVCILAV